SRGDRVRESNRRGRRGGGPPSGHTNPLPRSDAGALDAHGRRGHAKGHRARGDDRRARRPRGRSEGVSAALETLRRIREELEQSFVERTDVITGALVALLSRSHVLLVGPPGTAKSMLADELCKRIGGAAYFQWLLTKFTTPEEVFGAISLKGLESD